MMFEEEIGGEKWRRRRRRGEEEGNSESREDDLPRASQGSVTHRLKMNIADLICTIRNDTPVQIKRNIATLISTIREETPSISKSMDASDLNLADITDEESVKLNQSDSERNKLCTCGRAGSSRYTHGRHCPKFNRGTSPVYGIDPLSLSRAPLTTCSRSPSPSSLKRDLPPSYNRVPPLSVYSRSPSRSHKTCLLTARSLSPSSLKRDLPPSYNRVPPLSVYSRSPSPSHKTRPLTAYSRSPSPSCNRFPLTAYSRSPSPSRNTFPLTAYSRSPSPRLGRQVSKSPPRFSRDSFLRCRKSRSPEFDRIVVRSSRSPSPKFDRIQCPQFSRNPPQSPLRVSRSPSPILKRTILRHGSLSPRLDRSPSPMFRRNLSPRFERSPSPIFWRNVSPRFDGIPLPVFKRSLSPRLRSPSPRFKRSLSPRLSRSPPPMYKSSASPRLLSHSPTIRSLSPRLRRSPSPLFRRNMSPRLRSCSPGFKRSLSPGLSRSPPPRLGKSPPLPSKKSLSPRLRSSPSPVLKESPSPWCTSPSPMLRSLSPRLSRSPLTMFRRSVSPKLSRDLSPVFKRSLSPRPNRGPSTVFRSMSPRLSRTPSPVFKRSPRLSRSRSPIVRRSLSPSSPTVIRKSLSPTFKRSPSARLSRSPSQRSSRSPSSRHKRRRKCRSPLARYDLDGDVRISGRRVQKSPQRCVSSRERELKKRERDFERLLERTLRHAKSDCEREGDPKIRKALLSLWSTFEREFNVYLKQPANHPDYNKEYKEYLFQQTRVICEAGDDPDNYDFSVGWKNYWPTCMVLLMKMAWGEQKYKCLSQLLQPKGHHQSKSSSQKGDHQSKLSSQEGDHQSESSSHVTGSSSSRLPLLPTPLASHKLCPPPNQTYPPSSVAPNQAYPPSFPSFPSDQHYQPSFPPNQSYPPPPFPPNESYPLPFPSDEPYPSPFSSDEPYPSPFPPNESYPSPFPPSQSYSVPFPPNLLCPPPQPYPESVPAPGQYPNSPHPPIQISSGPSPQQFPLPHMYSQPPPPYTTGCPPQTEPPNTEANNIMETPEFHTTALRTLVSVPCDESLGFGYQSTAVKVIGNSKDPKEGTISSAKVKTDHTSSSFVNLMKAKVPGVPKSVSSDKQIGDAKEGVNIKPEEKQGTVLGEYMKAEEESKSSEKQKTVLQTGHDAGTGVAKTLQIPVTKHEEAAAVKNDKYLNDSKIQTAKDHSLVGESIKPKKDYDFVNKLESIMPTEDDHPVEKVVIIKHKIHDYFVDRLESAPSISHCDSKIKQSQLEKGSDKPINIRETGESIELQRNDKANIMLEKACMKLNENCDGSKKEEHSLLVSRNKEQEVMKFKKSNNVNQQANILTVINKEETTIKLQHDVPSKLKSGASSCTKSVLKQVLRKTNKDSDEPKNPLSKKPIRIPMPHAHVSQYNDVESNISSLHDTSLKDMTQNIPLGEVDDKPQPSTLLKSGNSKPQNRVHKAPLPQLPPEMYQFTLKDCLSCPSPPRSNDMAFLSLDFKKFEIPTSVFDKIPEEEGDVKELEPKEALPKKPIKIVIPQFSKKHVTQSLSPVEDDLELQ